MGIFSPAVNAASVTVTQIAVGTNVDQAPAGIVNSTLPTAVATHACALRSDGKVRCWGNNSSGELGNGTTTSSSTAVGVSGITTATQIAVGGAHTCALLSGGTVKCWGANNLYQTGDGVNTTTSRTTPVSVSGITNAVQISAGNQHTCAVLSDGTTKCWGANNYGQYGNAGTTQPTDRLPVTTPGIVSAVQIVAGVRHTCVLSSEGTGKCWGNNGSGRLGRGNQVTSSSPVPIANAGTGTTMNGIAKLAAGGTSTCAVTTSSTVRCWGNNNWGQIGNGTNTSNSNATANNGYVTGISTATDVTVGAIHACATLSDNSERCWGDDTYGELGDAGTTASNIAVDPSVFTGTTAVAAGSFMTCQLTLAGTVRCVGLNDSGQLGDGTTTNATTASVAVVGIVPSAPVVTGLPALATSSSSFSASFTGSAGSTFNCSLDGATPVPCTSPFTGSGLAEGQHTLQVTQTDSSGDTSDATKSTWSVDTVPPGPATLSGIATVTNLTTATLTIVGDLGSTYTCALDGAAPKACANPATFSSLAEGSHRVVVKQTDAAGNVGGEATINWTVDTVAPVAPQLSGAPSGSTNVANPTITFTNGEAVTYVCSVDGAAFAACSNPFTLSGILDGEHTFSVKAVDAAGNRSAPASTAWTVDSTPPPTPWAQVPSVIATGSQHACARMSDRQVTCWGNNDRGQIGIGSTTTKTAPTLVSGITNATSVTSGSRFSCALLADTTVSCWGANANGQLGDGSVVDHGTPAQVPGLSGALAISAGTNHICAVINDGSVRCWGANANGQLGSGTQIDSATPGSVSGISGATAVQSGYDSTCALINDGTIKCWGNGNNGRLGNGSTTLSVSPVSVSGVNNAVSLGGGGSHFCAVLSDATAKCWGYNISGQLGNGSTDDQSTAKAVAGISGISRIAGGQNTTCAVLKNGSVDCWGSNSSGQLGDGTYITRSSPAPVTDVSGATQVAVGSTFACAILQSGDARCWGQNNYGQLGNRTTTTSTTVVPVAFPQDLGGVPKVPSSSRSASITFSAEGAASFKCSLDGATATTCTSPLSLSGLADGSHSISITAIDPAGNSSAAATSTWTVDNTPPAAPTLSGAPNGATNLGTTSISFSGEDGAAFQCSWDGEAFAPCTSPSARTFTGDGNHSFSARQTDIAGNTSASGTASWKIDTVAPTFPTIDLSGAGSPVASPARTPSSSASIKIVGEVGATFLCALDGAASYTSCTSPLVLTGLAEGYHTLLVRQVDTAGNKSPQPNGQASLTGNLIWNVDTEAPSKPEPITGIPTAPTKTRSVQIGVFGIESGATLKCTLDGNRLNSCPNPWTINSLTDGTHTVQIIAVDSAGNSSEPAGGSWVVDNVAPAAPGVTGAPVGTVNSTTATINLQGEEGATFYCSLDNATPSACASNPLQLSGLGNSAHNLRVRQADQAGNISDWTSVNWTVNHIAPKPPTLDPAFPVDTLTKDTSVNIQFRGDADAATSTFQCSVDGAAYSRCTTSAGIRLSGLAEGNHTVLVTQTSAIGNVSDPLTVAWTVDRTGPAAPSLENVPEQFSKQRDVSINITSEPGATFQCSFDSAPLASCTSPAATSGLTDGPHTFTVVATDAVFAGLPIGVGNTGSPATVSWTTDTSPPLAPTLSTATPRTSTSRNATFTFEAAQGETAPKYTCVVDGGAEAACTSPLSLTGLVDGPHSLDVKTVDRAGNKSTKRGFTWSVDATPPPAPSFTPTPSTVTTNATATIYMNGEDSATYNCLLDGASVIGGCSPPLTFPDLAPGVHRFEAWQTDAAGNSGPHSVTGWLYDPAWPSSVAKASAGASHTCAFGGGSGKITCWGLAAENRTVAPSGAFTRLSTGADHGCAVSRTFALTCWGVGTSGQATPPTEGTWIDVSSGAQHSCALSITGTAGCWGSNTYGQATVPDATFSKISAGSRHTCAIKTEGRLLCWGSSADSRTSSPVGLYTELSSGADSSCAIGISKAITCWGSNANGKSTPPTGQFTDISVGTSHACAISVDGEVKCWGLNTTTTLKLPDSLKTLQGKLRQVSTGVDHTCATDTDDTVVCWGSSAYDKTLVPDITQPGTPTLGETPNSITADNFATFKITGHANTTLSCNLDDTTWKPCTSPITYDELADGDHNFKVRELSRSLSPGEAVEFNWTIDTVAPPSPTAVVALFSNLTELSIPLSGSQGSIFECSIDDAGFSQCDNPAFASGINQGKHSIEIRQRDAAGNTSKSRSYFWTTDLMPPGTPTVTGQFPAFTKLTSTKITIVGDKSEKNAAVGFMCQLDGGAWTACTSPATVTAATPGPHTFSVRQDDKAGNTGTPKVLKWTLDTVAPAFNGAVTAKKVGKNMLVTSAFNAAKGAPTLLEFNIGKPAPSPKAPNAPKFTLKYAPKLTVLKQTAIVWVRIGDAAGNWSPWLKTK